MRSLCILLLSLSVLSCYAIDELWFKTKSMVVVDNIEIAGEYEVRNSYDLNETIEDNYKIIYSHYLPYNLSTICYFQQTRDDGTITEDIPAVGIGVKKWGASASTIIEYMNRVDKENQWRSRTRVGYKAPTKWVQPFVSGEAFIRSPDDVSGFTEYRFKGGTQIPIKRCTVNGYYMKRYKNKGDWEQANIIGFDLEYKY